MLRLLLVVSVGLTLGAQTQIDLRTQARNIDFSGASSTRPMAAGTTLPATCAAGAMFFKTNAAAGQNLYGCTAVNTWTAQGGIALGTCQYNADAHTLTCTDSHNNVYSVVETANGATANQWVDYIAPSGAPHSSQPAFAQLSGTVSASQLPATAMLANQSNTVTAGTQDFSGAAHTLPMKSGLAAARPAQCTPGELYFAADAPLGANVYGCTALNVWDPQGNLSIQNEGVVVGSRSTANFIAGVGVLNTVSDNGSEINIQSALDTAVVQTQPGEQSGGALLCASNSGSGSQYACALSPTLAAYSTGMMLHWKPDATNSSGAATLNVDTLGAAPLKLTDGATDPPQGTIVAGQLYEVWYDGNVFRICGGQTWGPFLTYVGPWAGGTSYTVNQAVSYSGGLYVAIQAGAGNQPDSSPAYWIGAAKTYPAAGVPNSTGSGWGSSYAVGAAANNLVQLNAAGQLPAVSAALLTNFPTLNQSTTGTASSVTGIVGVANGGTGVASLPGVSGSYLYNSGGALGAKTIAAGDLPAALSASSSVNGTAIPLAATLMTTSTGLAASQMPALAGDVTSAAGSAATTVGKVNGSSVPAGAALLGTNSSSQLVARTMWGTGLQPVAAGALGVAGDCVQWSAAGIGDTGAPCGTGSSSGANALGYYFVSQSANASANAVNLGALNSGLLKISVAGGIATPSNATPGTDYVQPSGSIGGNAATATALQAAPAQCPNGNYATGIAASGAANCGQVAYAQLGGAPSALPPNGAAGGDLSGAYPAPTVAQVHGTSVPANSSADQVLGTTASGAGAWLSVPNCGAGNALQYSSATHTFSCGPVGSSMRTWPSVFQGLVQAGVAGFTANLPSTNAPAPTNAGGTDPVAVLDWPQGTSAYYAWWEFQLPAGYVSNSNISYSLETRCNPAACDSTHATAVTLYWACIATGALDAPAWTSGATPSITNAATGGRTLTAGTIAPTCAAGNRAAIKLLANTTSLTAGDDFQLVSATFSVQGGL